MKRKEIKFLSKRLVSVPVSYALQIYRQTEKEIRSLSELKELGLFCFQNETNMVLLKVGNYLYSDTEVHVRRHKPTGVPLRAPQVSEIEGRFKLNLHIFIVLHDVSCLFTTFIFTLNCILEILLFTWVLSYFILFLA